MTISKNSTHKNPEAAANKLWLGAKRKGGSALTPTHVYLTGDTHGSFERIYEFCQTQQTTRQDLLVILGDAGINYYGSRRDSLLKKILSELPVTIFCIHGNHEQRPTPAKGYVEQSFCGGTVLVQPEYPNLLFAVDGEVYDLMGKSCLAIGGAYSVDREYRLARGWGWWPDEQPDDAIKAKVESVLERRNWQVDVILSHTCPLRYEPTEVFLPFIDQSTVDKSTEIWLAKIESRLHYQRWYCGHYHVTKQVDNLRLLFEDYLSLGE